MHLDVAQEGCHGSLLCCDIFINEQKAEVNIVVIKSTVGNNLEAQLARGKHRCHASSLQAFKYIEWEQQNEFWQ